MTNEEYKIQFADILFQGGFYVFFPKDIQEEMLEIAEDSAIKMIKQLSELSGIPEEEIEDHCRGMVLAGLLDHALYRADFSYESTFDSAWN